MSVSGSETRRLQAMLAVRMSDAQLDELKRRARLEKVTLGEYVRRQLFSK